MIKESLRGIRLAILGTLHEPGRLPRGLLGTLHEPGRSPRGLTLQIVGNSAEGLEHKSSTVVECYKPEILRAHQRFSMKLENSPGREYLFTCLGISYFGLGKTLLCPNYNIQNATSS